MILGPPGNRVLRKRPLACLLARRNAGCLISLQTKCTKEGKAAKFPLLFLRCCFFFSRCIHVVVSVQIFSVIRAGLLCFAFRSLWKINARVQLQYQRLQVLTRRVYMQNYSLGAATRAVCLQLMFCPSNSFYAAVLRWKINKIQKLP